MSSKRVSIAIVAMTSIIIIIIITSIIIHIIIEKKKAKGQNRQPGTENMMAVDVAGSTLSSIYSCIPIIISKSIRMAIAFPAHCLQPLVLVEPDGVVSDEQPAVVDPPETNLLSLFRPGKITIISRTIYDILGILGIQDSISSIYRVRHLPGYLFLMGDCFRNLCATKNCTATALRKT